MSNRLYSGRNRQKCNDGPSDSNAVFFIAIAAIFIGYLFAQYRIGIDLNTGETVSSFKMDGYDCQTYHGEGRKNMTSKRGE